MKRGNKGLTAVLLVLSWFLLAGCGETGATGEIPTDVMTFLGDYMEAYKEGAERSVDFVYFLPENSERYGAYRNSGGLAGGVHNS